MKIGVMLDNLKIKPKKVFGVAEKIGVSGVQINLSGGEFNINKMNESKIAQLQYLLELHNLEISAFCGDLGGHGFMEENKNAEKIVKTKKMIDVAAKMGVGVVTTHIGVIPSDKTDPVYLTLQRALTEVGIYAKESGVTLAIETGPELAITLKEFIDSLKGGIGVNFDPANFVMVVKQDPVEGVHILKDYIVHTHAKDGKNYQLVDSRYTYGFVDNDPNRNKISGPIFEELAIGSGDVNFPDYIKALKEIGYNGYLTIEREAGRKPEADITGAVQFLKKIASIKEKFNIAVIGCGSIANGAHLPSIAKTPSINLKYVVDIIPERAEKAKRQYGASYALTDYKEILKDKELDGVIICTHTAYHTIIAIDCLNAGINVMSEKPVAINYENAIKMAETAKLNNKILNIGVCNRYNTAVNMIKNYIDSGKLGKIYHVVCSFRSYRNVPGIGGDFTTKAMSGGGVLIDWGVHFIDLIMYCLSEPKPLEVVGNCYQELTKDIKKYNYKQMWGGKPKTEGIADVEEFVSAYVKTEGASLSLNGAWAQNIDKEEKYIDFLGDLGGVRLNYCGNFTFYGEKDGKLISETPKFIEKNMYHQELLGFLKDIANNTVSRANIVNILPTTKIMEGIYLSGDKKAKNKL